MTRSRSSVVTGMPLCTIEVPMSPRTTPPSQPPYWLMSGSSRLSCWRSASYLALSAASLPRIARAGSPGSAWVAAKTTIDTSSRVSSPRPMRMRMSFRSGGTSLPSLAGYGRRRSPARVQGPASELMRPRLASQAVGNSERQIVVRCYHLCLVNSKQHRQRVPNWLAGCQQDVHSMEWAMGSSQSSWARCLTAIAAQRRRKRPTMFMRSCQGRGEVEADAERLEDTNRGDAHGREQGVAEARHHERGVRGHAVRQRFSAATKRLFSSGMPTETRMWVG